MIRTALVTATLASALVAGSGLAASTAPVDVASAPVLASTVTPLPDAGLSARGAVIVGGRVLTGGIVSTNANSGNIG